MNQSQLELLAKEVRQFVNESIEDSFGELSGQVAEGKKLLTEINLAIEYAKLNADELKSDVNLNFDTFEQMMAQVVERVEAIETKASVPGEDGEKGDKGDQGSRENVAKKGKPEKPEFMDVMAVMAVMVLVLTLICISRGYIAKEALSSSTSDNTSEQRRTLLSM